jgi:hypothetical protein
LGKGWGGRRAVGEVEAPMSMASGHSHQIGARFNQLIPLNGIFGAEFLIYASADRTGVRPAVYRPI